MPRKSPEATAAVLWRTGGKVAPPPANLGEPEAKLWRAITAARPVDWFDAASLPLLQRYVRTAIHAEKLADELDLAPIGSPAHAALVKMVVQCNASLGGLAARLRLSTQVSITPRSTGHLGERGWADSALLGGKAIDGERARQ
jgi:hypothetical protein